jgi:hypothetical protein
MTRTPRRLWLAALFTLPLAANALAADQVKTTNGIVEGTGPQSSGVRMFKGIPFAAGCPSDAHRRRAAPGARDAHDTVPGTRHGLPEIDPGCRHHRRRAFASARSSAGIKSL